MLPQYFKFHIYNNTGILIPFNADAANNTFSITAKPWKYVGGALSYVASEQTWFAEQSAADLALDGDLEAASPVNNSSDLYLGAHCTATLTTDVAVDGSIDIYMEYSTDGGTNYPSDLGEDFDENTITTDLVFVASLACDSTDDDRSINFELY